MVPISHARKRRLCITSSTPEFEVTPRMDAKRSIGDETGGHQFCTSTVDPQSARSETIAVQGLDRPCNRSVLVVAPQAHLRRLLASTLAPRFALVESAESTATAEALLARCRFDLLISAFRLPETSTPDWTQGLRRRGTATDVLLVANARDREQAARAANNAHFCLIFGKRPTAPPFR